MLNARSHQILRNHQNPRRRIRLRQSLRLLLTLAKHARGRPTCFRIPAIPLDWGKEELKDKLAKMDPDLNLENVELTIFPVCSHFTKTQTALLRLDRNTAYFEGWKQSDEKRNTFKEQDKPTVRLNIDKHFYGLTPLNKPDEPITAEFVSLHILEHCLAR
jgi:hypothetical protein